MIKSFDEITLRNVADLISDMLTHKQITEHFNNSGFINTGEGSNKTDRVYYSFKARQKQEGCGNNVLAFIQTLLNPKRYNDEAFFEKHRTNINEKLIYEGIEIDKFGQAKSVTKARTITEAKERSLKIKSKVHGLTIHSEIIPYCEEEWLKENYFHAILEITKSVAQWKTHAN